MVVSNPTALINQRLQELEVKRGKSSIIEASIFKVCRCIKNKT